MSILITGGAGFIGRHTARLLQASGREVVLLDNLSTGREQVSYAGLFFVSDIADTARVRRILREHAVTSVLHLAGSAHVGDSMARPAFYYANNVCGTAALLEAMLAEDVRQLVFASSCSVYGNSASSGAREEEAVVPVSPYGESKLVTERALGWYQRAHGLRWAALRYFNVAGAEGDLGEDLAGSRRIIPRAVHAALGAGPALKVFGSTFATPDGSAVRDYVHVSDVARANLCALSFVEQGTEPAIVNILSRRSAVSAAIPCPIPFTPRSRVTLPAPSPTGRVPRACSDGSRDDPALKTSSTPSLLAAACGRATPYPQCVTALSGAWSSLGFTRCIHPHLAHGIPAV